MAKDSLLANNVSGGPTDECESALDCMFDSSDGSFTVLKLCFTEVREYNFCDCSPWYGFTGVDCNQPSVQTRYFTSSLVFFLFGAAILLLFSVFELARHVRFIYITSSRNTKLNVGLTLLTANVGAALSIITYSSVKLRAYADPSKMELVQYNLFVFNLTPDITVINGTLATACLILANEFFVVAAMQVSLSWIDVATDVWRVLDAKRQKKVKRIKRLIQLLTALSLSGVLAFLVPGYFYAATFICIINAILLLIMFIYGRWVFLKLVKGISQEEIKRNLMTVVIVVKQSSLLHIVCLGTLIFLLALYYINFGTVYENITGGGFNYVLLLRDLSLILGTIVLVADTYYVHNLFRRLRSTGKPSTTGSNPTSKNRSRNQIHAEDGTTERSVNNARPNDEDRDGIKALELPYTASLVRRKVSVSVSVNGMFDEQSKKKVSTNTISGMGWEV